MCLQILLAQIRESVLGLSPHLADNILCAFNAVYQPYACSAPHWYNVQIALLLARLKLLFCCTQLPFLHAP